MLRIFITLIAAVVLMSAPPVGAQVETYATIDDRRIPTIAPLLNRVTDEVIAFRAGRISGRSAANLS